MKTRFALAAIAAAAIPQMGQAIVGSSTSASVNVRLAGISPIQRSSAHDAGVGEGNASGNEIQVRRGDYFAQSSVGRFGGSAELAIRLDMKNTPGLVNEADATATVTLGDTLTFTGTAQSPQRLHLHKVIRLSQFQEGAFTPPSPDELTTSELVKGHAEISGEGIRDGSITDDYRFFADSSGHSPFTSLELPWRVSFDMDFTLGETKEFDLTLSAFLQMINLNDGFGDPFNRYSLAMRFLSGGTLTDAATGNAACGITASSASGFDYLAGIDIGACQVGGGGGSGGTGDVPEPASWALMLGGFGLVGGSLRRAARRPLVSFSG